MFSRLLLREPNYYEVLAQDRQTSMRRSTTEIDEVNLTIDKSLEFESNHNNLVIHDE